jgi:hypothetical protein
MARFTAKPGMSANNCCLVRTIGKLVAPRQDRGCESQVGGVPGEGMATGLNDLHKPFLSKVI